MDLSKDWGKTGEWFSCVMFAGNNTFYLCFEIEAERKITTKFTANH